VSCEETCLLVSWCVGDRCGMVGSDEDWVRSRRLSAENRGWLGRGQVLGAQTTVDNETRSASFLVWNQNHGQLVFLFRPQNRLRRFGELAYKITATISWFGPQNQVGYGLSVVPQNWLEDEDDVGHASRSSSLLHVESSWTSVSHSSLMTGGGIAQIVHVASSWRSRGDEAEDGWVDTMGCIELFYPYFAIFVVVDRKAF
jgi:hypothetical protein